MRWERRLAADVSPGMDHAWPVASNSQAMQHPIAALPGETIHRSFDLYRETPGPLIALKEAVYGRPVDRKLFAWKYFAHPRADEIRVFVGESRGEIVAATTRLPATLIIGGVEHPAYFNIDSMVRPDHRRKGHMRALYKLACKQLPGAPLLISKGSSEEIYPLLRSLGHRVLRPDTFLVSRTSPVRWILSRLGLRSPAEHPSKLAPADFDDFEPIARFGKEHDGYFDSVSRQFSAIFRRDAAYMNWRYVDIPHRQYASFQRVNDGQITSVVVLALHGTRGLIVDILWDIERRDEPDRSIRFSQAWLSDNGGANVACFATHLRLREALRACGFVDRGDTPHLSAFVPSEQEGAFRCTVLHVVDGDGDTELS